MSPWIIGFFYYYNFRFALPSSSILGPLENRKNRKNLQKTEKFRKFFRKNISRWHKLN